MAYLGVILLLFGAVLAYANWSFTFNGSSKVPPLGGLCLLLGFLCFDITRPYAWLGLFLDSGILLVVALPFFIIEMMREGATVAPQSPPQPQTETPQHPD